ncbi:MAG: phage terminase large subunit, partial [Myxococcales bacterium]
TQYLYLFSRLRRLKGLPVPLRVRAGSNPGGVGHEWVYDRFFTNRGSRVFVRSLLEDNPHLDQAEYEQSLQELDPVTRLQLRKGDWSVRQKGPLFRREWFTVVDEAPPGIRWVRRWDLAATELKPGKDPDWTAGVKVGMKDGVVYIADVRRTRARPQGVEDLVKKTADNIDGRAVAIRMEQEPGSAGVNTIDHYARRVLPGYDFRGERSTGDKVEYARPLSAAAENGNVRLVRGPWNKDFLDEVEAFPTEGVHDDQVDAASKGYADVARPRAFVV